MPPEDIDRLRHMYESAQDALEFTRDATLDEFLRDRQMLLAVRKCLEIIGEAATRISNETRGELPDVPWSEIIGMRHVLVHVCYDVDPDIVWRTVKDDLPIQVREIDTYFA